MSDTIHSSDSVISYVTWLFVLCWRCRKLKFHRCRGRGGLSRRKLTQPLLVEIKAEAAFATGDCRNPKNLCSISRSLWWLSTHAHIVYTTVLENVFIYFRAFGMILYYRALTVVYYTCDCQVFGSNHRLLLPKYKNIYNFRQNDLLSSSVKMVRSHLIFCAH
jgi:hypothetical protein